MTRDEALRLLVDYREAVNEAKKITQAGDDTVHLLPDEIWDAIRGEAVAARQRAEGLRERIIAAMTGDK